MKQMLKLARERNAEKEEEWLYSEITRSEKKLSVENQAGLSPVVAVGGKSLTQKERGGSCQVSVKKCSSKTPQM